MTHVGMFEEIDLSHKFRKLKKENKKLISEIEKLKRHVLDLERIIEEKDNEIIIIKNR
jgi:uncharacterized protein YlxW (UPF0749 family)|tara:strand:- start:61 stop:234 length:174 start_codon:yes stop_codon:yes gene_type:complete